MACKKDNHSLYGCKSFIALSPDENGAHPGQSFLYELLEIRTFHEAMPFLPEMREMSGITPFLAPQGLSKETLKVWAIITVFTDSRRPHGDTYM